MNMKGSINLIFTLAIFLIFVILGVSFLLSGNLGIRKMQTDGTTQDLPTYKPDLSNSADENLPTKPLNDGWEQYVIPEENMIVSFPSDWKIRRDKHDSRYYIITSPNNFQLTFRYGLDGLGGGCDEECSSHNIDNVVLDTVYFHDSPLNIVMYGLKERYAEIDAFTAFNVIPETSCFFNICYGYSGKNTEGTVIISGYYTNDAMDVYSSNRIKYIPPNEFANSPDVQTALEILHKVSY